MIDNTEVIEVEFKDLLLCYALLGSFAYGGCLNETTRGDALKSRPDRCIRGSDPLPYPDTMGRPVDGRTYSKGSDNSVWYVKTSIASETSRLNDRFLAFVAICMSRVFGTG